MGQWIIRLKRYFKVARCEKTDLYCIRSSCRMENGIGRTIFCETQLQKFMSPKRRTSWTEEKLTAPFIARRKGRLLSSQGGKDPVDTMYLNRSVPLQPFQFPSSNRASRLTVQSLVAKSPAFPELNSSTVQEEHPYCCPPRC